MYIQDLTAEFLEFPRMEKNRKGTDIMGKRRKMFGEVKGLDPDVLLARVLDRFRLKMSFSHRFWARIRVWGQWEAFRRPDLSSRSK